MERRCMYGWHSSGHCLEHRPTSRQIQLLHSSSFPSSTSQCCKPARFPNLHNWSLHPLLGLTTSLCPWDLLSVLIAVVYKQVEYLHAVCSSIYITYFALCYASGSLAAGSVTHAIPSLQIGVWAWGHHFPLTKTRNPSNGKATAQKTSQSAIK